jgi:hypothetical protein
MLLTARSFYSVRGVKPGTSLKAAARRLHIKAHPIRVGANGWVLFRFGKVEGVLKVRRGRVEEVGIEDRLFTRSRHSETLLLRSF